MNGTKKKHSRKEKTFTSKKGERTLKKKAQFADFVEKKKNVI